MSARQLVPALLLVALSCAGGAPPEFDAARVIEHVDAQCALGPRLPGSAARDSAAAYIARSARTSGAAVSVQSFTIPDPYNGERRLRLINVIASFDASRTRRVMLASHYDSRPWADQDPDSTRHGQPVPGAVDGACSTGILLEMGRLLGARMPREIGVDLVFFDGEDYGKTEAYDNYLLGSRYFAGNLAGYRPECVIVLDMVGGVDTRVGREGYSQENARALTDSLFARARRLQLDYFVDHVGPPIFDDHVPLLRAGLPAVDLFGYDYTYWHTVDDTPDKCDPGRIGQVGTLLTDFLYDYRFRATN